jgi:hypothetical protein
MNRIPAFIAIATLGTLSTIAAADMYKTGGGSLYAGGNYTLLISMAMGSMLMWVLSRAR